MPIGALQICSPDSGFRQLRRIKPDPGYSCHRLSASISLSRRSIHRLSDWLVCFFQKGARLLRKSMMKSADSNAACRCLLAVATRTIWQVKVLLRSLARGLLQVQLRVIAPGLIAPTAVLRKSLHIWRSWRTRFLKSKPCRTSSGSSVSQVAGNRKLPQSSLRNAELVMTLSAFVHLSSPLWS